MKTHLKINDKLIKIISHIVELNYRDFKAFKNLKIQFFFKKQKQFVLKKSNISNKNLSSEFYQQRKAFETITVVEVFECISTDCQSIFFYSIRNKKRKQNRNLCNVTGFKI